jgi:cysteinyl-tRNA synthetase
MRLYNTLTRTVEDFTTRDEGRVGIYLCGPTVQNVPHFGHARAALVPDVLRRWLTYRGYTVFFVRNITDVDDKIIDRAALEGQLPATIAETYTRVYDTQMARLNVLPPDVAPRATGHIIEMIGLIERLVEVGAAYEAGGDVFFSVRKFDGYGQLSGRNIDDLRSGARVEPTERKRDPLDFALWKAAKPGEPSWTSPWGRGRPGWHIECSAMAAKYLGVAFDIHAGGLDLIFPHHENEIAQSEAASGRRFARYWLHNGMVTLDEEKMSKSVGNVIGLTEALDRFGPNILRLFLLSAHYRSPVDFSEERLADMRAGFDRWTAFVRATQGLESTDDAADLSGFRQRFEEAMDEDLGTAGAQAALFDLVAEGNRALERGDTATAAAARDIFTELAAVLGFDLTDDQRGGHLIGPLVEELLLLRQEARARKDFSTADQIRDRLGEIGIAVEDTAQGARWHVMA